MPKYASENPKTNLFLIDDKLWKWARYRAMLLNYSSVSDYIFALIKADKEKQVLGPS